MPAAVRLFLSMDRRSKEQMRQEKLYQATMSMVRKMLAEGLITEEEYRRLIQCSWQNTALFSAHYAPKSVDFTAF